MSIFIQAFIAEINVEVNTILVNIELNIYKLRVKYKKSTYSVITSVLNWFDTFIHGFMHLCPQCNYY